MADSAITVPAPQSTAAPNQPGDMGLGRRKPLQSYLDLFTIPEGLEGDEEEGSHVVVPEGDKVPWWRKLGAYIGPGFLVAVAYIDPANLESDLKAGASYTYELLWMLVWASAAGLLVQSQAARLGIVTGKHLAQHCRLEYPKALNIILWIIAEVGIIASDIPQVVGTAFALNMLFGIPLWAGVLLTGLSTLLLLGVQRFGVRKMEAIVAIFVLLIAVCFFVELGFAQPNAGQVFYGMLVPQIQDIGALAIAISLIGALVMPHNLFLHSALVLTRKKSPTPAAIKEATFFSSIEMSFALVLSLSINIAIVCVAGAVCSNPDITSATSAECSNITLNNAYFLLQHVLGSSAATVFGVALLASGQSSTLTGTLAGQHVMQGFLDLQLSPWLRNLITRLVAIVPSLAVALAAGSTGAGQLIIASSIILSIGLPYALIPLLKFTSSTLKMGPYVTSRPVTIIATIAGILIIAANCILLGQASYDYILSPAASLPSGSRVPLFILAMAGIITYLLTLLLLAIRKDQQVTYTPATEDGAIAVAGFMGSPMREGTTGSGPPSEGGIKMVGMAADLLDEGHVDSATLAAKGSKGAK